MIEPTNEITITGITDNVRFGKDGYVAEIKTKDEQVYNALISIPNLGRDGNYTTLETGDEAILKGILRDKTNLKVNKILAVTKKKQALLINDSFVGISPGDDINKHKTILTKTSLKTGEGDFEAYKITNKLHGELGYLLPDPKAPKLVGNIFISNPKAMTKDGFHIGSSLGDLLSKYPEAAIHGSEIEGRTHAIIGKHFFLLDSPNFTYDIKKGTIPEDTKVLEIMIQK